MLKSTTITFLPTSSPSLSVDLSRLLDCLAQVESGRNDNAIAPPIGHPIARGRYQLTEPVWFQHTNRPWKLAHNYLFATIVAERHLAWLAQHGPNNPYWFAAAWRHGLEGYVANTDTDYCNRVVNLYNAHRS